MANGKWMMANVRWSICLLPLAICHLPCRCWGEPLAENQARFGIITGDVGLLSQGAVDWIEPHEGLPIEPGDHIRTGEDGTVELVMSEKALWVLEPQTEVVMEHTEMNSGRLDLPEGKLIGRVDSERAAATAQRWEFDMPAAVAAIRGTEFGLSVSRQEGNRLGVFEGNVELQPAETAEGLQPVTEVPAGHEAVVRRGKPIQTLAAFSPGLSALAAKRQKVRLRQRMIENTWSPFTPSVRKQLRSAFVSPPPKRHYVPHAPSKNRRHPHTDE